MCRVIFLLSLSLIFVGCSKQPESNSTERRTPVVYASNYPLAYFAERIFGNATSVVFPQMEGDPAYWKPSPDELLGFQQADLILLNGATYEKWLSAASLPSSRTINTSTGFKDKYIILPDAETHSHGDGTVHSHDGIAFTTWLDPLLAIQQAASIADALEVEASGFKSLRSDLFELDKKLSAAFAPLTATNLIGSHPVYQYLQRRYGLKMESVHWEPDTAPTAEMWAELEALLEIHPSRLMLWEDQPLPEVREQLLAKGIQSVVFNPAGNRPENSDFLTVMDQNIQNLISATSE